MKILFEMWLDIGSALLLTIFFSATHHADCHLEEWQGIDRLPETVADEIHVELDGFVFMQATNIRRKTQSAGFPMLRARVVLLSCSPVCDQHSRLNHQLWSDLLSLSTAAVTCCRVHQFRRVCDLRLSTAGSS